MSYIIFDEKHGIVIQRIDEKPTPEHDDLAVRYHLQTGNDVSLYEHVGSVTPDKVKRHHQRQADATLEAQAKEAARIQRWNDEQAAKRVIEEQAAAKEAERIEKARAKELASK